MRTFPGYPVLLPALAVLALAIVAPPAAIAATAAAGGDGGLPPISYGLKGGLSLAQHQGTTPRDMQYTVDSESRKSVTAGLFLVLPVTERFSLQQEVLYVRKGSRQDIGVSIFDVPAVLQVSYDMDYLEIPVLTRYQWTRGRAVGFYTLAGFGFGLKVGDRYRLSGLVDDGTETIPLNADSDMSEVDMFDFHFTYGVGLETPVGGRRLLLEYRFDLSLDALPLPTYADVPFGAETMRVDNEPVPLRNQCHMLMLGVRF
ncbi:MAG: PorT family protein [Krumholzibacteria bacterium]|nr:PorT family protein [Candidatus Krumholzibacteria bacterium]